MWVKMPATMIRKVALVQGLREAFPDKFQGMYDQSEMGTENDLPENTIPQDPEQQPINGSKKKAMNELIGREPERVEVAKKVLQGYGYSSCKAVLNGDYEDIMSDLNRAFVELTAAEEDVIDIPAEPEEIVFEDGMMGVEPDGQ